MGLISFLQKVAEGKTDRQTAKRYERANNRSSAYMEVVQWYLENADESPQIAQDYTHLITTYLFRASTQANLISRRNDMERKLAHAQKMTPGINAWIAVFRRPSDMTVYCCYVLLRDNNQQFAVMKPYWFLDKGETEKSYMTTVTDSI